jgi:hypothetical protein
MNPKYTAAYMVSLQNILQYRKYIYKIYKNNIVITIVIL